MERLWKSDTWRETNEEKYMKINKGMEIKLQTCHMRSANFCGPPVKEHLGFGRLMWRSGWDLEPGLHRKKQG